MFLGVEAIRFEDVRAVRDERGSLSLPITEEPPAVSRLRAVSGRVVVQSSQQLSEQQLALLADQVEIRCPIANMLNASGCKLDFTWSLSQNSP